jgi:hypothetical protein
MPRVDMERGREYQRAWRAANPEKYKSSILRGTRNRSYEARRNTNLRTKYGITLIQYNEMNKAQGGVCALCSKPPKSRNLDVDHCHKTGRVRGLLCPTCNSAILGHIESKGITLEQLAAYLA